jgi:hypothetical protein
MQCLFCGNAIPLRRKFLDSDFCCADHRNQYSVTMRSGMARLMEHAIFTPPPPQPSPAPPVQRSGLIERLSAMLPSDVPSTPQLKDMPVPALVLPEQIAAPPVPARQSCNLLKARVEALGAGRLAPRAAIQACAPVIANPVLTIHAPARVPVGAAAPLPLTAIRCASPARMTGTPAEVSTQLPPYRMVPLSYRFRYADAARRQTTR